MRWFHRIDTLCDATILMSKDDWLSIDWSIYCERTEDLYNHSNHSVLACY
jgi:hypothetical protein